MVQILSTLIRANGGQALVAGRDLVRDRDAVRGTIGVTGQVSAWTTCSAARRSCG